MPAIDLNCDMGESFGAWKMGNDEELMNYVTSVNIACGFHAGDATTMRKTVELAVKKGLAIGAHPSYPDLQGFGRRAMSMSLIDVTDIVLYQVAALKGICEASGARLHHVKPHGALYSQAAKDTDLAGAIAEAVHGIDPELIFYGLSESVMIDEASRRGLRTASEVFSDRTYGADGMLTPRTASNALISDVDQAAKQVMQMVQHGTVTAVNGNQLKIQAETICIHGDGDNAVGFAKAIREVLTGNGIHVRSI
jgi:UPF0271 protein